MAAPPHKHKKFVREPFALNLKALSRPAEISENILTASFPALESNARFKVKTVSGGSLEGMVFLIHENTIEKVG